MLSSPPEKESDYSLVCVLITFFVGKKQEKTEGKTLANRPSAWQVTLPGFLPGVISGNPLIFKGFWVVVALLGSKKSLARKKKHADF